MFSHTTPHRSTPILENRTIGSGFSGGLG